MRATAAEDVGAERSRRFSDVAALKARGGSGRFEAVVDPEWTIGGKPNGGYLLAILGRAAISTLAGVHQHVIAASAHYVRSPEPGPVDVETEILRTGRSASQVRVRMSQSGQLCVDAPVTVANLPSESTPYWDRGLPERSDVSYEDCVRLIPSLGVGRRVAIMEHVEVRLERSSLGFSNGQPQGRGELRGWLRLPDDEPFDSSSLLFALDAFPPATNDLEFAGWVPTFELTAYVRALPAPGPVRVLQKAQLIEAQQVDEVCFVWDATGRLVAQGTQLAGIRLG